MSASVAIPSLCVAIVSVIGVIAIGGFGSKPGCGATPQKMIKTLTAMHFESLRILGQLARRPIDKYKGEAPCPEVLRGTLQG